MSSKDQRVASPRYNDTSSDGSNKNTHDHSVPQSTSNHGQIFKTCWSGSLSFPSATPASSISISDCNAILVKTLFSSQLSDSLWKEIEFPKLFTVQGRIEMNRAVEYWKQVASKCTNRCISIARLFTSDTINFETLYNHLSQKERYAVIYSNYGKPFPGSKSIWTVKDLYLVHSKCDKNGDSLVLPEPFDNVTVVSTQQYGLFLIAVLSKVMSNHVPKKPIASIHHRPKRKNAPIDSYTKNAVFKDEPLGEGILSAFITKK